MNQESHSADTTAPIRVMLVDDHAVFRMGFRTLLEAYAPRIKVVAEASSASDALARMDAQGVDILLTDLKMEGNPHSGLELVAAMRERHPKLPVIVVDGDVDDAMLLRVFKAGASGFVPKECEEGEILHAIETVHRGFTYFPHIIKQLLVDDSRRPTVTQRERQICDMIGIGLSSRETALVLGISTSRTVESHRSHIDHRIGKSGTELVHHCIDDLYERLPALARGDDMAKLVVILKTHGGSHEPIGKRLGLTVIAKLVVILAHYDVSHALIGTRLGLTVEAVAALAAALKT